MPLPPETTLPATSPEQHFRSTGRGDYPHRLPCHPALMQQLSAQLQTWPSRSSGTKFLFAKVTSGEAENFSKHHKAAKQNRAQLGCAMIKFQVSRHCESRKGSKARLKLQEVCSLTRAHVAHPAHLAVKCRLRDLYRDTTKAVCHKETSCRK